MKRTIQFAFALAVAAFAWQVVADMGDIVNELQRKRLVAECRLAPHIGTLYLTHCVGAANVIGVTNRVYTGAAITFDPVVVLGGNTLTKSTDYTQAFTNNTNVGKATVRIAANRTGLFGSIAKTFEITPHPITDSMVSNITAQAYTGSPVEPTPSVVFNGSLLSTNTDYSVSYADNVASNAHAKCIITGKGNFGGEVVKEFTIGGE